MMHTLTVQGMHCNACVTLVHEALEESGAKKITIALDEKKQQGILEFESSKTKTELVKIIEGEGDYIVV